MIEQSRHLFGTHAPAFVFFHRRDSFVSTCVYLFACRTLTTGIGETGTDISRHHHTHGDSELPNLVSQRQGHRIDSRFGSGVERLVRNS